MAFATFPSDIPPHQASPGESVSFEVRTVDFGDGYTQRSAKGINNKVRKWSLVWQHENSEDVATIKSFLDSQSGHRPFFWTAPGDGSPSIWTCVGYTEKDLFTDNSTLSAEFELWRGAQE